jgi:hypothetical protein
MGPLLYQAELHRGKWPQYSAAMTKKRVHLGPEELIEKLRELTRQAEAGELECTALRLFLKDGTYEDVALGGTDEEQKAALAELRKDDLH